LDVLIPSGATLAGPDRFRSRLGNRIILGRVLIKPRGPLYPPKGNIVAHVGLLADSEVKTKSGKPTPRLKGSVTTLRG
jgi:hypothetical protein